MLLVKTKLGPSKINGIGLFADQLIPKGTIVQKFIAGIDIELSQEKVDQLPEASKNQFVHYAYKHKVTGNWLLNSDDARFLNHSDQPNLVSNVPNQEIDIAAQDIYSGEELTVNYKDFDNEWYSKLHLL